MRVSRRGAESSSCIVVAEKLTSEYRGNLPAEAPKKRPRLDGAAGSACTSPGGASVATGRALADAVGDRHRSETFNVPSC